MMNHEIEKNLELEHKIVEQKYKQILSLIENEDKKSQSYYNNSLLLLTIETTLILSLLTYAIHYIHNIYSIMAIFVFNICIIIAIHTGLKNFKK